MRRLAIAVAVAVVALAACGGDDEEPAATPESPATTATPRSPSGLPPEFVKCMADRGFDIQSPADMHAAPPGALQACFGSLHQGGGS